MPARGWVLKGFVWLGMCAALVGCPKSPQQLAILASPDTMDFALSEAPQTFIVRTNMDSPDLSPFTVEVAKAAKDWLFVSPTTGTSTGPDDAATFTVTVKRDKMRAGINTGTISVVCPGLVPRTVTVTAKCLMAADFLVDPIEVFTDEEVAFQDSSQVAAGERPINAWEWDFGDNTPHVTGPEVEHTYRTAGQMTVKLTTRSVDREDTETKVGAVLVKAKVAPTAAFTANNTAPLANTEVQFTDQSTKGTSDITNWFWTFGDGQQSTQQNPKHTYTRGGFYEVSLTVTSAHGTHTRTAANYIRVVETIPTARFTVPAGTLLANSEVRFTDTSTPGTSPITSWAWDFGDNSQSNAQHPGHTYSKGGDYKVRLTVATAHGTSTAEATIRITERVPVAEFTASATKPFVNDPVTFTDLTNPGTSPITEWQWNFGDGTGVFTSQNVTHAFTQPGKYTVSLTVKTAHGTDKEEKFQYIEVLTKAPKAEFSATPTTQFAGHPVQFTDLSESGTAAITEWRWNFGDGTAASTEKNPRHTYATAGTYTVSLTVTSKHGNNTATKAGYIKIDPTVAPQAEFSAHLRTPYEGDEVRFTDQSTPGSAEITSWTWNFGDQTPPSTERNPKHIYGQPGTFTVSLTVKSQDGTDTETKVGYITARPNVDPVADFEATTPTAIMGDPVTFRDLSKQGTSPIISWEWNFGDQFSDPQDNVSSLQNPSHTYAEPGRYTVTLKVITAHGTGSKTRTNYIVIGPRVDFSATPLAAAVGKEVRFTDLTQSGSTPIQSWQWQFGDGMTASSQNPAHIYGMIASYNVTLNVTLANGVTGSLTKTALITTSILGPTANFTASNYYPAMFETVIFTDTSDPGSGMVTSWAWDFDGNKDTIESRAKNPVWTWTAASDLGTDPPQYQVTLTVTTPYGSSSKTVQIVVGGPAPVAQFTQDKTVVLRGEPVTFTSTSTVSGVGRIFHYEWYVWKGGPDRPSDDYMRSSSSVYTTTPTNSYWSYPFHEPGMYNVALEILASTLTDPGDPDDPRNVTHYVGSTIIKTNAIEVREPSELDMYVRAPENAVPDPNYTLSGSPIVGNGYKAFVVKLTPLTWQAPGTSAPAAWNHWLTVIQPTEITNNVGLLYLTGGFKTDPAPRKVNEHIANFAVKTGSVVAVLQGLPNQPFAQPAGQPPLLEDSLIAASMKQYLDQHPSDPKTLALFPMVKSTVKAMDTVQRLLANPQQSGNYPPVLVPKFVVAGGSTTGWSRGWTTYLAAVADPRVKGIVPMSFDGPSLYDHFDLLQNNYGYLPEGLSDYQDFADYTRYWLSDPSQLWSYLHLKEMRRRVERALRVMHENYRDEGFLDPVTGNNFDGLTALRDLLMKEEDPGGDTWQVLARLRMIAYAYSRSASPSLHEAIAYGDALWTDIDTILTDQGGADDGVKHGIIPLYAGYTWSLYDYRLEPDHETPVRPKDVAIGKACYLIWLMEKAEAEIRQIEKNVYMQYMIDPIMYNDKYAPILDFASEFGARLRMPKYILLGTGDEDSVPTASYTYFGDLNMEKHLRYYVGTDRGLGGFEQALYNAIPWYMNVVGGTSPPNFSWQFHKDEYLNDGFLEISVAAGGQLPIVKIWRAFSKLGPDFRIGTNLPQAPEWSSFQLPLVPDNAENPSVYRASTLVAPTLEDWTAYFAEFTYPSATGIDQVYTTDTRIIPPYESPYEKNGTEPPAAEEAPPATE